jgi:hypothetical protein
MRRVVIIAVVAALMLALTAGVAWAQGIVGTPNDDTLFGTADPDQILALEGDDFSDGFLGDDIIVGNEDNDNLLGAEDSDDVNGGDGSDTVDLVSFDTAGSVDSGKGGKGNDIVQAKDGNEDIINCGPGKKDKVFFDVGLDSITRCEVKNPSSGAAAANALADEER